MHHERRDKDDQASHYKIHATCDDGKIRRIMVPDQHLWQKFLFQQKKNTDLRS